MRDEVRSKDEAMQWFLSHSGGTVTCVSGGRLRIVDNYPEAEAFFDAMERTKTDE